MQGREAICCGKASNAKKCNGTARQGTAKESHCSEWYRTAGALKGEASKRHCSAVLGNGEAWSGSAMALHRYAVARLRNAPNSRASLRIGEAWKGPAWQRKCTTTTCEGNGRIRKSRHGKGKAILIYAKALSSFDGVGTATAMVCIAEAL
jgi:hypothetical protein